MLRVYNEAQANLLKCGKFLQHDGPTFGLEEEDGMEQNHTTTMLLWYYLTLSQTSRVFLRFSSARLLKTLWEKEKLLVTSNFSFSHSVSNHLDLFPLFSSKFKIAFCKLVLGRVQDLTFVKGLTLISPK